MIQVEKHGSQYGWYKATCPECSCEFVFNYTDIIKRRSSYDYLESVVYCPECGNDINNWKVNPR